MQDASQMFYGHCENSCVISQLSTQISIVVQNSKRHIKRQNWKVFSQITSFLKHLKKKKKKKTACKIFNLIKVWIKWKIIEILNSNFLV